MCRCVLTLKKRQCCWSSPLFTCSCHAGVLCRCQVYVACNPVWRRVRRDVLEASGWQTVCKEWKQKQKQQKSIFVHCRSFILTTRRTFVKRRSSWFLRTRAVSYCSFTVAQHDCTFSSSLFYLQKKKRCKNKENYCDWMALGTCCKVDVSRRVLCQLFVYFVHHQIWSRVPPSKPRPLPPVHVWPLPPLLCRCLLFTLC